MITTANIASTVVRILGTVGLISVVPVLYHGRTALRHTSLTADWWWLLAGVLLWDIAWITTILTHHVPRGVGDVLWYTTGVLLVCPPVAVLGARRPAARVWAWFVLVPLVLILSLPVIGLWNSGLGPLEIEVPAMAGYLLVLVMGTGNYIGTRNTTAAILLMGALGLLVIPLSSVMPFSESTVEHGRVAATILAVLASNGIVRRPRRPPAGSGTPDDLERLRPLNRLWIDFRDTFGIVWAQRIRERVNATAGSEDWPVRLDRNGFVLVADDDKTATDLRTRERIEQTLRWLLRRFVDPVWIDRRLAEEESVETKLP